MELGSPVTQLECRSSGASRPGKFPFEACHQFGLALQGRMHAVMREEGEEGALPPGLYMLANEADRFVGKAVCKIFALNAILETRPDSPSLFGPIGPEVRLDCPGGATTDVDIEPLRIWLCLWRLAKVPLAREESGIAVFSQSFRDCCFGRCHDLAA